MMELAEILEEHAGGGAILLRDGYSEVEITIDDDAHATPTVTLEWHDGEGRSGDVTIPRETWWRLLDDVRYGDVKRQSLAAIDEMYPPDVGE